MQAVYSFTAASAGILALTSTTVHMFDVYRKAGISWFKLQQAGQDVSIGHSQPEVAITLPGEYIVAPDDARQVCTGDVTFAFIQSTQNVAVSLQVVAQSDGTYALTPFVNGVAQQGGLPLRVVYDATGEVDALTFNIEGIDPLFPQP